MYGADLARAHHEGFGGFARGAAAALLDALGPVHRSGLVVDLGCGSGILARIVTEAGYQVLGFDLSPDMVRLARDHAPRARFVTAPVLDAAIPPCVAVTAVGEVLNYAFDPRTGLSTLGLLLGRVAGALRPGGILLFDSAGPGRAGPTGRREASSGGNGWSVRSVAEEAGSGTTLVRDITLVTADRRHQERHVLCLYPPGDVEDAVRAAGFAAVRRLGRYGDVELPPGLTGFQATR